MVTRSELQKKYKLKILLRGITGTGKTLTCVDSRRGSRGGRSLICWSYERGYEEELMKLDDKTLENIILGYKIARNNGCNEKTQTEQGEKLKLIIMNQCMLLKWQDYACKRRIYRPGILLCWWEKVEIDNKGHIIRGFMCTPAWYYISNETCKWDSKL